MRIMLKKAYYFIVMILCIPFLATIFVKPGEGLRQTTSKDNETENTIDASFVVVILDEKGRIEYKPESFLPFMTAAVIPWDLMADTSDEEIINEYLKTLCVMCRTNLVRVWYDEGCPEQLLYEKTKLNKIYLKEKNIDYTKIIAAVKATNGVVITTNLTNDDIDKCERGDIITAPFFTSAQGDILARQKGDGDGLSINYALIKAQEGMDFVDILKFFYEETGLEIL